jgi:hypothetical protein
MTKHAAIAIVAAIAGVFALSGSARPFEPAPAAAATETLLAAGDIASCASSGDEATANLLDTLPGTIIIPGDIAYESGTTAEFNNCYHPSWGRHKARTRPSPGNHEYNTPGATGYYGYFGAAAGDPTKGYYSFDLGDWHIVSINSNCSAIGGCGAGSAQEMWLRADLAASDATCTLAFWHHPRFSSGDHGNTSGMQAMWQALYEHGADVVIAGHDHNYERFDPQTATGLADPQWGIRSFVVGTGGKSLRPTGSPVANSVVRDSSTYGVLQLTLDPASYAWEFKAVTGGTFTDTGSASCVEGTPDDDGDGVLGVLDNCPDDANPSQVNSDRDFIDLPPSKPFDDITRAHSDTAGDACDDDDDNDGIDDTDEGAAMTACPSATSNTSPSLSDTDGDRALDGAECTLGTDPASASSAPTFTDCGGAGDDDGDGVTDSREICYYNTSTSSSNTDGDGCGDAREIASINADLTVTVIDLQQIASAFGPPGSPQYLVAFDVTKDGTINVLDLAFTAGHAGACP